MSVTEEDRQNKFSNKERRDSETNTEKKSNGEVGSPSYFASGKCSGSSGGTSEEKRSGNQAKVFRVEN